MTEQAGRGVAVVTGGSRGLGRSMALALAAAGHDVVLTYRSGAAEAAGVVQAIAAAGGRGAALPLDTGEMAQVSGFADALSAVLVGWGTPPLVALVNNGGMGLVRPFAETTEADFDALCNVHLKGVYFLTQRLAPMMADGGRILMVSSRTARQVKPGYALYGPMKAAVEALVRYLAVELGPRGITVNAVAPGAVATDFRGGAIRDDPALQARLVAQTPLGRMAGADDIGHAVADLLTGRLGWMTGETIALTGGQGL